MELLSIIFIASKMKLFNVFFYALIPTTLFATQSNPSSSILDLSHFLAKEVILKWNEKDINSFYHSSNASRTWLVQVLHANKFSSAFHSRIFGSIVTHNHTSLFKAWISLQATNGLDLSLIEKSTLNFAVRNENLFMVETLLTDPRFSIRLEKSSALQWASKIGLYTIVELILSPRFINHIDPSTNKVFFNNLNCHNTLGCSSKTSLSQRKSRYSSITLD